MRTVIHRLRAIPNPRPLVLLALLALAGACAEQDPMFDSVGHLRQEYAERTDLAAPEDIQVPFELDDDLNVLLDATMKPAPRETYRLEQVNDFIFRKLQLRYSLRPTRNAMETYRAREGNCLSFVNLFIGVARHNRLAPFYVEVVDHQKWRHQNGMVLSQGHIVAGMYVSGELRTFDFLPYTPKSYKEFKPIDDLTATAHFYNNLAGEALIDDDVEAAQHYLAIATDLVPTFEKALNNLGVVLARKGEYEAALQAYEKGLQSDPSNVPILTNLARLYQLMGRLDDAETVLAKIEGFQVTNPFYFVYRGELALANGNAARALEYLREALRIDSEIPEVHVALVKVYMALGDLEKARHFLGRAMRLDATNPEARDLAKMLANP